MSEDLFHLLYFSRAANEMASDTLADILEVSRERNAERGITGLLLFENQFFLQILEGAEAEVRALYAKIRKDPRHCEVFTIGEYSVDKPQFESWAMAHYQFKPEDVDLRRRFNTLTGTTAGKVGGEDRANVDRQAALRFVAVFESLLKTR